MKYLFLTLSLLIIGCTETILQPVIEYRNYTEFVGVISQYGEYDPTIIVVDNKDSLKLTFTRINTGWYRIKASDSIFSENKTVLIFGDGNNRGEIETIYESKIVIELLTYDIDVSPAIRSDFIFNNARIIIRIYK